MGDLSSSQIGVDQITHTEDNSSDHRFESRLDVNDNARRNGDRKASIVESSSEVTELS